MDFTEKVLLDGLRDDQRSISYGNYDVDAAKVTHAQLVKDNSAEDLAWALITFATAFRVVVHSDDDIVHDSLNAYIFPKVPQDVFARFKKMIGPIKNQNIHLHPATVLVASLDHDIVLEDTNEAFTLL